MPVVHRPAVVLLFLLLAILNDGAFSRNVNFHNVRPPVSPTPFPNSFKCFTCNNALDNYECNRWAEDKWCPHYTAYCLTVHRFASHGRSESVSKRCVSKEECHSVGCHHFRKSGYTGGEVWGLMIVLPFFTQFCGFLEKNYRIVYCVINEPLNINLSPTETRI